MRFLCTTVFQPSVDSTEAKSCFHKTNFYNEMLNKKNWEGYPEGIDWEVRMIGGIFSLHKDSHKMRRERSRNEIDKGKAKKSEVRRWISEYSLATSRKCRMRREAGRV